MSSQFGSRIPTLDDIARGFGKRPLIPPVGGPAPPTSPDLLMAVRDGDVDAMSVFFQQSTEGPLFDVNNIDRFGRSLLWFAVKNGHFEATQFLLQKGAEPNIRDLLGWMPLHLACFQGLPDIARLLLEKGAELDAKTWAGQTPRWLAHSKARPGTGRPSDSHAEIAALLEELGGALGLPPREWVNPRRPRQRKPIPPDEVRCCLEDGERYKLADLVQAYVVEKEMYTEEECEDYFRKDMQFPAENHAAWQHPPFEPALPGEGKYG